MNKASKLCPRKEERAGKRTLRDLPIREAWVRSQGDTQQALSCPVCSTDRLNLGLRHPRKSLLLPVYWVGGVNQGRTLPPPPASVYPPVKQRDKSQA